MIGDYFIKVMAILLSVVSPWNVSLGLVLCVVGSAILFFCSFYFGRSRRRLTGFVILLFAFWFFISSLLGVFFVASINNYSDKLTYGENLYVTVVHEAGEYRFVLNERVMYFFRGYHLICSVRDSAFVDSKPVQTSWVQGENLDFYVYYGESEYNIDIKGVHDSCITE